MTKFLVAALAAAFVAIPSAWGTKPPAGSSTGTARVFLPNPVADLQNESLTDQKDADYPALQAAYHTVKLTNLDGTGFLCGDWACVYSETGNPAYSPTNTFSYNRHDDEFEQTMAYYWITEAQKYIQSLGFGSVLRPVEHAAAEGAPQPARLRQLVRDDAADASSCASARAASTMPRTRR